MTPDPGFALAHAKLSAMQTQYYLFGYDASHERLEQARQALERALAIDPRLPEAQLAASSYWLTAGDLANALSAAEAAERLRPNDAAPLSATTGVLWRIGRWDDAASRLERACRLGPRDAMLAARLGVIRLGLRQYREARHAADQSIALERDQVMAYVNRLERLVVARRPRRVARAPAGAAGDGRLALHGAALPAGAL